VSRARSLRLGALWSIAELAAKLGMTRWACARFLRAQKVPIRQPGGPGTKRRVLLSDLMVHWPEGYILLEHS
jgi:hypothetical protein